MVFVIAIVISVLGSLPPGMINLSVLHHRLQYSLFQAVWMAAGAAIVEVIQVIVIVWLASRWHVADVKNWFDIAALLVLGGLGVYYWFLPTKASFNENEPEVGRGSSFAKGALISMANVMVYPFWLFYSLLLTRHGYMSAAWTDTLLFALGVGVGTWLVLWWYGKMSGWLLIKIPSFARYANRVIAVSFFVLALLQYIEMQS
ncbi:MAG: hypothetical protein R2795_18665 [Saprospiraceae bacterium]